MYWARQVAALISPSLIRRTHMASPNNKLLQKALAIGLKASGFRKVGATWRKRFAEAVGVINLQGSQWGPSFYINLGVHFTEIGEKDEPLEYHCHIRSRLEELVSDPAALMKLLDFEKPLAIDVLSGELNAIVMGTAVPWLERVSNRDGALEYCRSEKSPHITLEG
jgi:Domain of unknown function (DUF4304)